MICSSWSWPNMFDVAQSKVSIYNDTKSITNRVKLLLLTEPTELYMCPNFGVGLKKYIFRYNNDNVIAMIRDDLVEQLRIWEPAVIPDETKIVRGLSYTQTNPVAPLNAVNDLNKLEMTVTLTTAYMRVVSFGVTEADIATII